MESFQSVKDWFESLKTSSRKKEVSPAMRLNYLSGMKLLVEFHRSGEDAEADPDTILEWTKSVEPKDVLRMLNDFEAWLQGEPVEGYTKRDIGNRKKYLNPTSAFQKSHGIIRGFFTHGGVLLPKSSRKINGRSATKKNDATNYAIFKISPDTNMIVKDYSEFRFFLSHLTPRDQTIGLCMLSTGQDPSDVLNLDVGFVKDQASRERLYWEGVRNKTGEEFRTFFSKEATAHLRQYISQERKDAEASEKIFERGEWTKQDEERTDEFRPMAPRNLGINYNMVAKRMGLINGDAQNPFRPKRMRSIFSSACYQAKTDDGLRHIFMGHKGTVSERYREMPLANLEQKYAQVEPFVTVYSDDRSQELVETRQKSEKALDLALDIREENKELKLELDGLRSEMKKQERLLEMVIERMIWLEGETTEEGAWVKDEDGNIRFKFAEELKS